MSARFDKEFDPKWAWERYVPSQQNPWNIRMAGHLYRRAAFGANQAQLEVALRQGPQITVDALLHGGSGQNDFQKTAQHHRKILESGADARAMMGWWLFVITRSPHPLQEKLTLFWHNHFATSQAKVQNVGYMLAQNETLRKEALGNFRIMLQAVSKDPAMLVWLDGVTNKKGKPNENYARELMELFSLGVGNYTEQDIRQAARAFTGWDVKNDQYVFTQSDHDNGSKNVFGKTANFTGEQVVDLCLEKDAAAKFIVRKLIRYFISETMKAEDSLIEPLASQFRKSDYQIAPVVETILRSNLFYSEHAYRQKVKSPIEFVMSIIHTLSGKVDMIALAASLENLGQKLFHPPSVKGWDAGESWLNSNTLLLRNNLALALVSTDDSRFRDRCDPVPVVLKSRVNLDEDEPLVEYLVSLFLQGDLPNESKGRLLTYCRSTRKQKYPAFWTTDDITEHRIRSLCHLVLTQPEFQLN